MLLRNIRKLGRKALYAVLRVQDGLVTLTWVAWSYVTGEGHRRAKDWWLRRFMVAMIALALGHYAWGNRGMTGLLWFDVIKDVLNIVWFVVTASAVHYYFTLPDRLVRSIYRHRHRLQSRSMTSEDGEG